MTDRRDVLRAAVAAGIMSWEAPRIVAAGTVEPVCSPKCVPMASLTVTGTLDIEPCIDGTPAGQQVIRGQLRSIEAEGVCPCSAAEVLVLSPLPGEIVDLAENPGNATPMLSLSVVITCQDRAVRAIERRCQGDGIVPVSGNCNSLGGQTYTWTASIACEEVVCR